MRCALISKKPGKNPLIVGIDPGTTTGLALFDLDGNLVLNTSGKNLSRADVVRTITDYGNPIIFSSDRNPMPTKVEKIAAAFFAKTVFPEKSLRRRDKLDIVREWKEKSGIGHNIYNRHERDALASALFAWNKIRPLVRKVNKKLEDKNFDTSARNYIKVNVLLKGENISTSIKRILKKNEAE